jgi:hypothetical protein
MSTRLDLDDPYPSTGSQDDVRSSRSTILQAFTGRGLAIPMDATTIDLESTCSSRLPPIYPCHTLCR